MVDAPNQAHPPFHRATSAIIVAMLTLGVEEANERRVATRYQEKE